MDKRKIIYYSDEANDEFSVTELIPKKIDENYIYCHNTKSKAFTRFFWYRIVAMPVAYLFTKIKFGHRIIGKEKLKDYRHKGYFLYGNHTQDIGDAFIPNMLDRRQDKYVIVHPNNLAVPVIGPITPSLGAIPLPDNIRAAKNFAEAISRRIGEGHTVVIYPEAHIWPYYTKIRSFSDKSFAYPVKLNVPVFTFTNTYVKRRFRREPRIVTYIDGPFFSDPQKTPREARAELRDLAYRAMTERAKLSNVQIIEYIYKPKDEKND